MLVVRPDNFGISVWFGSSFKQFATSHPVAELRTTEEAAAAAAAAAELKEVESTTEQISESDGVEVAPVEETEGAPKAETTVETIEAKELQKYLADREAFYLSAKEWDAKIKDFEFTIRRPYFHVKPLDDAQLGNWHRYLDFIEKDGGVDKVNCCHLCSSYTNMVYNVLQKLCM